MDTTKHENAVEKLLVGIFLILVFQTIGIIVAVRLLEHIAKALANLP